MKYLQRMFIQLCVLLVVASIGTESYALEGLKLEKAEFTLTDPSKEQPEGFITSVSLNKLRGRPIFFLVKMDCDTPECKQQLKSGAVKLIHRWVRTLGTRLKTMQKREFLPDEIKENTVWSAQIIRVPGDWFVEVRTSDGEKLCLKKDEASVCEFNFRVMLK